MQDQLKLAAKPQRQAKERQLEQTEQRAYDRAYSETRKEIAKAEGHAAGVRDAAGGNDPAVERARQRALGTATQPEVSPSVGTTGLRNPSSVPEFVDADVRGTRRRIPTRVYDLPTDQRERFFDSLETAEGEKKAESRFDNVALALLDQQDAMAKRVSTLESQLGTALVAIERLQQRITEKDARVEIAKSEALSAQQVEIAGMTVNLQAIGAEQEANHQRRLQEAEEQAIEHRQRLEATERVVGDMEGRLQSSGQLFQERSNAVIDELSNAERRQSKLAVQQTETSDGIASNRQALSAVTGTDFASEIDLSVKRSFDDRLAPELEALIERRYVLLAPTTGTDGYDPKIDSSAKPFLAEQQGDNAIERAVARALKTAGAQ